MIYAAIIAAAAALIGAAIASGDEAEARRIRKETADKYKDLPLPVLDKVVAQKLPPDAAERYLKSTQSTQAQSDVLGKVMEAVNEKGETADDRAEYLRMQNAAAGINNNAQAGIQRGMAGRGLAGSGLSYAVQQQGAQGAINRANSMGIEAAADARGRYQQALGQAGGMAGQMRGQELSAMHAQDEINMFNARQQADADFRNQQLPQQNFDNRMTKLSAEANANAGVANDYDRGAQNTRQTAGGLGNTAITAGAAYDQYGNPIKKKDDYASTAGAN